MSNCYIKLLSMPMNTSPNDLLKQFRSKSNVNVIASTLTLTPTLIQPPIPSSEHFIFQLYLTPPSFMTFSRSSRVVMKLYISIFQCLSFCWWSSRRTDAGRTLRRELLHAKYSLPYFPLNTLYFNST